MNRRWILFYLGIVAIIGFRCGSIFAQTPSNPGTLPSPSDPSGKPSFLSTIDTHWGGRLKTSGRVSQTDDDTIFKPAGTGTYWDGSFNYFLVQRLDRLYLAWMPQWGSVKIGRQAITWGHGFVFNPFDLFNPFPPTAIDRDYKVGDDMLNLQASIPNIGDLQGLYVARRDPDTGSVSTDQASAAAKLHVAAGTTEFDFMGGKQFQDYVAGIGTTGYIGDAAWRVDGTWTFLNDDDDYLSMTANMDYSWVWFNKNVYGFIEYYFNGLGKTDYPDAVLDPAIAERVARGELFALGRNYLSGHIQVELHPLFKVFFTAINNVEDPSGILQPYATWDISQNLQLTGGVNVSYGAQGTEYGGFILPGTDIRTRSPDNAYVWLFYYF